jgi:TRAP-type C4-dicarboxylate transport system permease large subunit
MTIIIKAILIILLGFIFFSLGSALYFLVHDKKSSNRSVKALTWRILLSLLLFLILMLAYAMGWITPHQP